MQPLRQSLALLSLMLALSLYTFRQTITNFNQRFIGGDADVYVNQWSDWWTWQWLTGAVESFWYTGLLFYPDGIDLTFHSFSPFTALFVLGLRPVFGPIAGYNLVMLTSHLLTGLALFHFARYLTNSAGGALLGAIYFAFNSHTLFQTAHPVLFHLWLFPWFGLCLLRGYREERRGLLIWAGILLGISPYISPLHLILLAPWLLFLHLLVFIYGGVKPTAGQLLLVAGPGLALGLPALWPLLSAAFVEGNQSYLRSLAGAIPTPISGFVVPNWVAFSHRKLYLGLVPLVVTAAAWRTRAKAQLPWLIFFAVIAVFAIGPVIRIGEWALEAPWSWPVITLLRHPHRLNGLLSLAVALLLAISWPAVSAAFSPGRRQLLLALAATVLFFDLTLATAGRYSLPATVSPFYTTWLAAKPPAALANIPFGRAQDKYNIYLQTVHGRPITGGVVSRSDADTYRLHRENALLAWDGLEPVNLSRGLAELTELGVGYIVVAERPAPPGYLASWQQGLPLRPVYADAGLLAYAVTLDFDIQGAIPLMAGVAINSSKSHFWREDTVRLHMTWQADNLASLPAAYRLTALAADDQLAARTVQPIPVAALGPGRNIIFVLSNDLVFDPALPLPLQFQIQLLDESRQPLNEPVSIGNSSRHKGR